MMTSPISNVFHPTVIDQTDRDPHRQRDDEAHHGHRQHRAVPHIDPPVETEPAEDIEHKTTGLLIDVRA